jgi:hypothetical protein
MNENAPKVVNIKWFTTAKGIVGIAAVRTETGNIEFRIGLADGFNEVIDANLIMSQGAPFPDDAGYAVFAREEDSE